MPTLKRPLYGPSDPRGPSQGRDVKDFVKRTLYRLPPQLPVGDNFFPRPPEGFNGTFNQKTEDAVKVFQHFMNAGGGPHIPVTGQFGQLTLDAMWDYADAYSKWVYRIYIPPKPKALMYYPLPAGSGGGICQGLHETSGIPGNWAIDFCDDAGTSVLSPEAGIISMLSGHDPSEAAPNPTGIYGWSMYVTTPARYVYFITHFGWREPLGVGDPVKAGQKLGTIGNQQPYTGRPNHTHIGVTSPLGETDAKARIVAVSTSPRL